ncbi:Eco57I restriction-modification methylase domain-containing protein [uncultured Propionibacterium sp.]|uniref:Eco57I restriction-modification methylase domain-containing protein n=1 Tax=uncultured Propionibacterium sp. TaxID=218066 RepID=UPI00293154CE|nr:class I SAM-dependent DNA methyltransferase [uncultured Propionibacterium sp.]
MATSDALVVVEDWISEHFFTSDSAKGSFHKLVTDRHRQWKAADGPTPLSRFTAARADLLKAIAGLYGDDGPSRVGAERARDAYRLVLGVLGYGSGQYRVRADGPVRWFTTAGAGDEQLAVVEATPVAAPEDLLDKNASTLLEPWRPGPAAPDSELVCSASRLVSALMVRPGGPAFALVLAGRWLLVAERARWPEGRYLAVDVQTVADRNDTRRGGEVHTALVCLAAESLAPDANGDIWWSGVLEASIRHTVGVSQDLREGVRESIEIIANEVIDRRRAGGLEALPADEAQPLAMQSLRFIYRVLFLLYAEASPELGVLPVGAPEYENGYSLDRLRDLLLVELTGASRDGTHLYDSLAVLFRLVDQGNLEPGVPEQEQTEALAFHALRADLFRPGAIGHIDEVGLGNAAMQQVLGKLLLSKERRGKDRGFISYAELGINQLGAVYEGLMSYTGVFAPTDMFEVAHDGDPAKGSWVVPVDRSSDLDDKDFVMVHDPVRGDCRKTYRAGQFVFRLSDRERQQSASYYTPEVLTRFTVSQGLAELLDQDGRTTPADEILRMSICEPALGSGAFAIEATRQLAEQYLARKQKETGRSIDPEDYPAQLQRTKAFIALHNVYGVDLNATAVEFAEITLWLDTMVRGLDAPWFGLHLRRGNSLIGARHGFYSTGQVADRSWRTSPPTDVPLEAMAERARTGESVASGADGRIPHFLLPGAGWGATADAKEARELAAERVGQVKTWRRQFTKAPTLAQTRRLVALGEQVERLWTMALRRLMVAEQQTRRAISLWGAEPAGAREPVVTREQIEASLANPDGAYRRLRRVMDAWCALWFVPLTGEQVRLPDWQEWIGAVEQLIGVPVHVRADRRHQPADQQLAADEWAALAEQESWVLSGSTATSVERALADHPWLRVCEQVADRQGFFHWQLDFATVFARGGFDLQVGNPPWVRPRSDVSALLAETDPWWMLENKPSEAAKKQRRAGTLLRHGATELLIDGVTDIQALSAYVGDATNYPELAGLQPDLYRCFMEQTWAHLSGLGVIGLVHPETHFTDEKAGALREAAYRHLRRHWQFVNELQLFKEIDHHNSYGVHVYGASREVSFDQACGLYHPDTVERSYRHDGSGEEPGLKFGGAWDQRPHAGRIQHVDTGVLETWRDMLESPEAPPAQARMLYTVNSASAAVLAKLAKSPRMGELELRFSRGWDESIDRRKGYFVQRWGRPDSWDDVILQGPHIHVANPAFKQPNATMKHNQDWSDVDLEKLPADFIPITAYKPAGDRTKYDAAVVKACGEPSEYAIVWRSMAANTGERTLIPALVPPGLAHLFTLRSVRCSSERDLVGNQAFLSSLLADFSIRSVPRAHILLPDVERQPRFDAVHVLSSALLLRALRLNCITNAYADLWSVCWDPAFTSDSWVLSAHSAVQLGDVGPGWRPSILLRRDLDRRQALVEIDALVALMLGVTADELCTIYRTQFAVLYGYDHGKYLYDANGRLVPVGLQRLWAKEGNTLSADELTTENVNGSTYSYKLPFTRYDREADMRTAYAEFESRLCKQVPEGKERISK